MKIKGFAATLYYWLLLLFIFTLFNGKQPLKWDFDVKMTCALLMIICAIMAHIIYWDNDHQVKKGAKNEN